MANIGVVFIEVYWRARKNIPFPDFLPKLPATLACNTHGHHAEFRWLRITRTAII